MVDPSIPIGLGMYTEPIDRLVLGRQDHVDRLPNGSISFPKDPHPKQQLRVCFGAVTLELEAWTPTPMEGLDDRILRVLPNRSSFMDFPTLRGSATTGSSHGVLKAVAGSSAVRLGVVRGAAVRGAEGGMWWRYELCESL